MTYHIVVDFGRPYTIIARDREELKSILPRLRRKAQRLTQKGDCPYFDVEVYLISEGQELSLSDEEILELSE